MCYEERSKWSFDWRESWNINLYVVSRSVEGNVISTVIVMEKWVHERYAGYCKINVGDFCLIWVFFSFCIYPSSNIWRSYVCKHVSAASLKDVPAFLCCTFLAGLLIACLIVEQQQCDLEALWCNILSWVGFSANIWFSPFFWPRRISAGIKTVSHHVDKIKIFPAKMTVMF
jgi:hypothetical protein